MKKLFFILGTILFSSVVLIACSQSLSAKVKNNISEESRYLFATNNEILFTSLTVGTREEPYKADGISNKNVKFAVINVFLYENRPESSIDLVLKIDNIEYEVTLEKHIITGHYLYDLEIAVSNKAQVEVVYNNQNMNLPCVSNTFEIDYEKALNLAIKDLNDDITKMLDAKDSKIEVFLKLINNPTQSPTTFYWYFVVKCTTGAKNIVVIDTMSPDIMAKF